MSDCELAYSTYDRPTRIVTINRAELAKDGTIHPTQKPIRLYEWILANYAQAGDKIIDTHAGSGSSCIACHRQRFNWLAFEKDKDYYEKAQVRIKAEQAQLSIFDFTEGLNHDGTEATDWTGKYNACGLYPDKPYGGIEVVKTVRGSRAAEPEPQITGQLSIFDV